MTLNLNIPILKIPIPAKQGPDSLLADALCTNESMTQEILTLKSQLQRTEKKLLQKDIFIENQNKKLQQKNILIEKQIKELQQKNILIENQKSKKQKIIHEQIQQRDILIKNQAILIENQRQILRITMKRKYGHSYLL